MAHKPEKMMQPTKVNDDTWPIGMLPDGTLNEVKPSKAKKIVKVKMSKRHSKRSPFAKRVKEMLVQHGLVAVRLNAHALGGSEQDCIRVYIYWLSNERPGMDTKKTPTFIPKYRPKAGSRKLLV